jgi:hypothetical protein
MVPATPPIGYWVLSETPAALTLMKADSIKRTGTLVRYSVIAFLSVPFRMQRDGADGWVQTIVDEVEVDCTGVKISLLGTSYFDASDRPILRDGPMTFHHRTDGSRDWQAVSYDYLCRGGDKLPGTWLPLDMIKEYYLDAAGHYVAGKSTALPVIGR